MRPRSVADVPVRGCSTRQQQLRVDGHSTDPLVAVNSDFATARRVCHRHRVDATSADAPTAEPTAAADPDLRRLEEVCLNSSATPRQLLYDGWLVRLSPGKAKRARSINAFYPSALPLDEKLARCGEIYAAHGLPLLVRVTPFVHPVDLDAALEARGYAAFEPTRVMTRPLGASTAHVGTAAAVERCDVATLVDAVSTLRGASDVDRVAHVQRVEALPLERLGFVIRDRGEAVCAGLVVIEHPFAGIFDVVTSPAHRGRGHASALTAAMIDAATTAGATTAYLQVDATNEPARAVYRRHGFVDRYTYWYRRAPGG
jgi:ribosomal protein S18 acetylase RimI-like enzyme